MNTQTTKLPSDHGIDGTVPSPEAMVQFLTTLATDPAKVAQMMSGNRVMKDTDDPDPHWTQLYAGKSSILKDIAMNGKMLATFINEKGKVTTLKPDNIADNLAGRYQTKLIDNKLGIFDASRGYYDLSEQTFDDLMSGLGVSLTKAQREIVKSRLIFLYKHDSGQRTERPYLGSEYIVFTNGVLNVATFELIPLTDPRLKELNLIERQRIDMEWTTTFTTETTNLVDSVIATFTDSAEVDEYFKFLLATMLFPGHRFGIGVSIQGESGMGKGFLSGLPAELYGDDRIYTTGAKELNEKFTMNGAEKASAIWLSENNEGQQLDAIGTVNFDHLAGDNIMTKQVKNKPEDVSFRPAPVFVDGTQFVLATDIHAGPYRRIMPFKISKNEDKVKAREEFFDGDVDFYADKERVQYLVYSILTAYKAFVLRHSLNLTNVKVNANRIGASLPKQVQKWREEIVIANERILNFVENVLKPYIIEGPMHTKIAFAMFIRSLMSDGTTGPEARRWAGSYQKFEKALPIALSRSDIEVEPYEDGRFTYKNYGQLGIDWDEYQKVHTAPEILTDAYANDEGHILDDIKDKQARGWYVLTVKADAEVGSQETDTESDENTETTVD